MSFHTWIFSKFRTTGVPADRLQTLAPHLVIAPPGGVAARLGPRRGPPWQGLRGPAEAVLRLRKSPYLELFERESGDRFPLFLPSWCPKGVPPPVDRVLIPEKVSHVKGVPGIKQFQNREDGLAYRPLSICHTSLLKPME